MAGVAMNEFAYEAAESWRQRAETDPLRKFVAHEKQTAFLNSTEREVYMLGANRSGKSLVLGAYVAKALRWGGAKNVWVVSPSLAHSQANIQPVLHDKIGDSQPFIPAEEIAEIRMKPEPQVIGKDGWVLTYKSGEQGRDKFSGAAVDIIGFDEPPAWAVYNECVIRIGAGKRCLIRMAATILPPVGQAGGVCQWLWSEKIKPWIDKENRDQLRIIQVSMRDNPHLTPTQLAEVEKLFPVGSLDYRIRILGELLPGMLGARAYMPFDRRLHVNKHIGPQTLDPRLPTYLGCDFNVEPLCAGILQKHGKVWRKLDEIVLRPGTIDQLAEEVCKRYGGTLRNNLVVCGDATGKKRTAQTGKTDYQLLVKGLEDTFVVKLDIPDVNPPERDRVNLVNFFLGGGNREVSFELSDSHCPESIDDYEQVLWKADGSGIKKSKDRTDPYYERTHLSDGDGYVLWAREKHVIARPNAPARQRRSMNIPVYSFGVAA